VDLHRFVDDPPRDLARVELGQARAQAEVAPLVLFPRGLEDHQARVLDLHLHVGQLERDRLELGDRPAELLSLLRVAERFLERAGRQPHR
jgi:hypothetical protein